LSYDSIIFDVDGTLWDATEASAIGWTTAMREVGIERANVTPQEIKSVCGLPLHECVATLFPDTTSEFSQLLLAHIDAAEQSAIEGLGGTIYEGVSVGLKTLSRIQSVYVVSNCQGWYLDSFWRHSAIQEHVTDFDCHGASGLPKSEMIKKLVARNNLVSTIYIGDTQGDQEASYAAGVDFGYVSYGFGQADNPTVTFDTFQTLVEWF
jgi:phosphoglycolate phosphatase